MRPPSVLAGVLLLGALSPWSGAASEDGARVAGTVVDRESGLPVADFDVRLARRFSAGLLEPVARETVRGRTDGSFELDGIPPGTYALRVEVEDRACASLDPVVVRDGEGSRLSVWVSRGERVAGRVVDAASGEPLGSVRVRARDEAWVWDRVELHHPITAPWHPEREATTDAEGRFAVEHLTPGAYIVEAEHPAYARSRVPAVEVREGRVTELPTVALLHGALLHGTVRFGDDPGARFSMILVPQPFGSGYDRVPGDGWTAEADAAGRFRFEHVVPGRYRLSAARPIEPASDPFVLVSDMKASAVEIDLTEGEDRWQDLVVPP